MMTEYKGVMVLGETNDGHLAPITAELLGCGRRLAEVLQETLSAVIIGGNVKGLAAEAAHSGADRVYEVSDRLLEDYLTETYTAVMATVVEKAKPRILLMGQTAVGRDLAPRLAFRLQTAAAMDCIELDIDETSRQLLQTRPVFGGNARAVVATECLPQIATVRAKSMAPLTPDADRNAEVISVQSGLNAAELKTRVVQKKPQNVEGLRLEDAAVVVGGGRGIGGGEGFKELEKLAGVLQGAVGASRPPCDAEWVPNTMMIGLTGKIIVPELYIAVALSGASQHMSGCATAKNIIAVNRDPEANIFREARYGVVGDWKKVLPAFTEKAKELLAE